MRSQPAVALLSNGSYTAMITAACTGYSTWRDLDITRWREDATRDCWGQFYYVRDLSDESLWSIGVQPMLKTSDECAFEFHPDRAEFRRSDGDVETLCAVCVVPDADAEVRAVTLVNHGRRAREFELTSYAEVCLTDRKADQAHPAFAKLFLETEFVPRCGALLARRRPRSAKEHPVWAIHASAASVSATEIEYETDRMRFLGRGRTPANPAALDSGSRLSRTTGPVLDPVFSSGVFIALCSGERAADAVDQALTDGDYSAARFQSYGADMCRGIEGMRRLVYAFYDHAFSFRTFVNTYPNLAGDLTDCLIGNLFIDFDPLFNAVAEFARVPAPLSHGLPLVAAR